MPTQQNGSSSSEQIVEQFFDYTYDKTLTGNQNIQDSIPIQSNSDFQCIWLVASSTGGFKIRFQDGATGRNFMSGYVNSANLWGTAQDPFPMLPPYVFRARSAILIDLTDTSGSSNTIELVFHGKKLFLSAAAMSAAPMQQSQ